MRWRAFYSLDRDEYEPIAAVAADVAENTFVTLHVGPDTLLGDAQLSFDFSASADDKDEVVVEGQRVFDRIRDRASLGYAPSRLLGFAEVTRPPWEVALMKAFERSKDDHHEEAVVFAQVACETRATDGLRSLLERKGIPGKLRQATELRDVASRLLLTALTGARIEDEDWWGNYNLHVKRRNVVIHEGGDVTRSQANESLEVARQFCDFISSLV